MVNQGYEIVSNFEVQNDGSVKSVNLKDVFGDMKIQNIGFDDPTPDESILTNLNEDWLRIEHEFCKINFDDLKIEKIVLIVLIALCSIEHAFLGYRHFRQTMFLSGAMFALITSYFMVLDKTISNVHITQPAALALAGAIGTIFGLITSMVDYLGLFLTGFYLGVIATVQIVFSYLFFKDGFSFDTNYVEDGTLLSETVEKSNQLLEKNSAFAQEAPFSEISGFFVLFISGAITAIFTIFKPKPFVIMSTAVTGSVGFVLALDWLVEDLRVWSRLIYPTIVSGKREENSCYYTPYIWATISVLTVLGILFQAFVSAKNYDHEYGWFNTDVVNTIAPRTRGSSGRRNSANSESRRNVPNSRRELREESNSSPTDDERSELISRNVNRTRSVPLAQPKRTKRTTENPRRVNSEIVRDPQDAFIVRPTAPPNSAPQTSNHHHLPRINVEATHNRPANLSRRVQTSSSRPGKNNNDDKAPPAYNEVVSTDR